MPGFQDIINKVKGLFLKKPSAPQAGKQGTQAAQGGESGAPKKGETPKAPSTPGQKKAFDIKLYMKAVQMFFQDFFTKKLPYFFKNMGPVLKGAPAWWNRLPQDEQISYGVLALGHLMFIAGIVLVIVL